MIKYNYNSVERVYKLYQLSSRQLKKHQEAELGDVLFTLVNIARWYGLDPSVALQGTNQRFVERLTLMETFAERSLSEYSLEELEALWQTAKAQLNSR